MADLPPLVFSTHDWRPIPAIPAADVGYTIKHTRHNDAPAGTERSSFRIGLCGCCNSADCGINCCVAQVFCLPCIWGRAMQLIGAKGAGVAAGATFISDQLTTTNADGGTSRSPAADAVAAYLRGRTRVSLIEILFGQKLESQFTASAIQCCLPTCAMAQELDAVLTYAAETQNKTLTYGSCGSCECFEFLDNTGTPVQTLRNGVV